jgi:hypothetical protein
VTPAELIDKLCEIHGVDNPNQLAPLIGMSPADLYAWRNKHAPNYDNTIRLLEAAGVLNFESPRPPKAESQTLDARLRSLEQGVKGQQEVLLELQRLVSELRPHRQANGKDS